MNAALDPTGNKFRARFPEQPEEFNSSGRMNELSKVLKTHFSSDDIEKIVGLNLSKYLKERGYIKN